MFTNVVKDVGLAMYASMVRGIVLFHAYHLKLCTTYGDVGRSLNVIPSGGQLAQALALITADDHRNGWPLSAAVVINNHERMPGAGFFSQARELGYEFENESEFWQLQLSKMGTAPLLLSELDELKPRVEPMKVGDHGKIVPDHVSRLGPGYKNRKPIPVIEHRFPSSIAAVREAARSIQTPFSPVVPVIAKTETKKPCDTDEGPCACGDLHVKDPASGLPT